MVDAARRSGPVVQPRVSAQAGAFGAVGAFVLAGASWVVGAFGGGALVMVGTAVGAAGDAEVVDAPRELQPASARQASRMVVTSGRLDRMAIPSVVSPTRGRLPAVSTEPVTNADQADLGRVPDLSRSGC